MKYLTHEIVFNNNGNYEKTLCTEEEASDALFSWSGFKPVPVPNKTDENRSSRYINARNIQEIYKRVSKEVIDERIKRNGIESAIIFKLILDEPIEIVKIKNKNE